MSENSALLVSGFFVCVSFRMERSLKKQDELLKIEQSSWESVHLLCCTFVVVHRAALSRSPPSALSKGHFVSYLWPAVFLSVITPLLTSHPVAKTKDQR